MSEADMKCKVTLLSFWNEAPLSIRESLSYLSFSSIPGKMARSRKLVAESTFCPESGDRCLGS